MLGAIEYDGADGQRIELVSKAQRRLVAALCLRANSVVPAGELEEIVGLSPGAMRTSISRLRRLIGSDYLVTGPTGYECRTTVDAAEFERLVDAAFGLDAVAARATLDAAFALWHGQPYAEFADEPWAMIEVARLRNVWAAATEELAIVLIDTGEHGAAITALEPLIRAEPYRDRPHALRMRALAEVGRRTEALRAYHDYRTVLLDDIGIEPSADLTLLDQWIASGADLARAHSEQHIAWVRQRGHATLRRAVATSNLPNPISSFIGRGSEVNEVVELIEANRLVTLTGSGGCGKSRLALRVAHAINQQGRSSVWWIDLTLLGDDADVGEHVGRALGLVTGPSPVGDLTRRLAADEHTLLVMDNAEHLVEPVGRFLADVLPRCPTVHALVTSRVPLGVAGDVLWRVPSLAVPDAAAPVTLDDLERFDATNLFLTRARAARSGLLVDRQAIDDVLAICHGLDGMPLALELAAARVRSSTLRDVAHSIAETLEWRATAAPTTDRHATLRSSIAWSFDLLAGPERRTLTTLSVFQSSFTLEAAIAVAGLDVSEGRHTLAHLVDASLLQLDHVRGRYRMLQTIKQFCLERLADLPDEHTVRAAHARYVTRWCHDVGDGVHGIERRSFIEQMPDVVAASAYAREHLPAEAMEMCIGLAPVRSTLGHHAHFEASWDWLMSWDRDGELRTEWAAAVAALMTTCTAYSRDISGVPQLVLERLGPDQVRPRSWIERSAAMAPAYSGRPAQIEAYVAQLLDRGDDVEASIYVGFAAYMLALIGRVDSSALLLAELRRITRRRATAFSVDSVGNGYAAAIVVDTVRGDLRAAAERGVRQRPMDAAFSMTSAAALAEVALRAGNTDTMEHALAWSRQGTLPILRYLLPLIACLSATMAGEVDEAADHAEVFWEQATVLPVSLCHPWPIVNRALLAAGRIAAAERATDAVAAHIDAMDDAPLPRANLLLSRAQIALDRQRIDEVDHLACTLLALAGHHRFPLLVVDGTELRAAVAASRGDHDSARRFTADVAAQRDRVGYRLSMIAAGA